MWIKISELTWSERLVLLRRRLGLNQTDMARRVGVPLARLKLLEHSAAPQELELDMRLAGTLEPYEQCFIARRRAGRSQAEVAGALGCCRYWLNRMERGEVPCHELTDHWFA